MYQKNAIRGCFTIIKWLRKTIEEGNVYLCKCGKCNKKVEIRSCHLRRRTGCGCIPKNRKERIARLGKKRQPKLYKGNFANYYRTIKYGAKRRARILDVSISPTYIYFLFHKQKGLCAISGVKIEVGKTASLDRIDSSLGYVDGNVQWVHKDINFMKQNFSPDKFMNWIEIIYLNKYRNQSN